MSINILSTATKVQLAIYNSAQLVSFCILKFRAENCSNDVFLFKRNAVCSAYPAPLENSENG